MNWMGLVAGLGGFGLGVLGASVVWGWWMRVAVRRARAAEARAFGKEFDLLKNQRVLNGVSRSLLESLANDAWTRAAWIEKGRA